MNFGSINPGKIVGLVISVVMLVVLLGVSQTVIPQGAGATYNLFSNLNNATHLGTGAVTLAGNIPSYTGWFWVLGPFVLVIAVVLGVFMAGRKKGGYRRRR